MGKAKEKGIRGLGLGASDGGPNVVDVPAVPPSLRLSAGDKFDITAMVAITALAQVANIDPQRKVELEAKLRAFELWEEAHRGEDPGPAQGSGNLDEGGSGAA
jgi:hypothetical protein